MANFDSATGKSPAADHATLTEIRSVRHITNAALFRAADRRPLVNHFFSRLFIGVTAMIALATLPMSAQGWNFLNVGDPLGNPLTYRRELFDGVVGIGAFAPNPGFEPFRLLHLHSTMPGNVAEAPFFEAYLRLQTQNQNVEGDNKYLFGNTGIEFMSGSTINNGAAWCVGKIMGVSSGQGVNSTGTPIFRPAVPAAPIDLRGGLAFFCSPSSQNGLPSTTDQIEVMRIVDSKVGIGTIYPQSQLHATKQIMTGETGFSTYDATRRGMLSFMPGSNSIQYHMDNRNGLFHISHGPSPGGGTINTNGSGTGDIMDILGWNKTVSIGATLSGGSYLRTFPTGIPPCSSGPAVGGAKLTVSDDPVVLYTNPTPPAEPEPFLTINPIVLRLERRNVFTADNLTTPYKLISAGDGSAESFIVKSNGAIQTTTLAGTGNRPVYANSSGELIDAGSVGAAGSWTLGGNNIGTNSYFIGTKDNYSLVFKTNDTKKMEIFPDGKVNIGTTFNNTYHNTNYLLSVSGKIACDEVIVLPGTDWSDFVFDEDYALPSLDEVESYIKINKHLPDIPSAQEVKDNGIEIGDIQAKLLQKIEELTLHVIRIEKELQQTKAQVQQQSQGEQK